MNGLKWVLVALLLGGATLAQAGFSITGTRVVYDEANGEATVHMQRTSGDAPVLLQVWLDDGDATAQPGMQDVPFILTPTASRVEAGRAQVIRILRTRDGLPGDRESLWFFNALEVPATDEAALAQSNPGGNHLRLAMQARMKFFYRPKGLQPRVEDAVALLRFTLEPTAAGPSQSGLSLRIHNPTPYHITVPDLALHASAAADAPELARLDDKVFTPMVAPFAELVVPLVAPLQAQAGHDLASNRAAVQVRYTVINDLGGYNAKTGVLGDAS